jgi:hypothetical protein
MKTVQIYLTNTVIIIHDTRVIGVIGFNAIFSNISVISWRSVLLAEETGGPGENHQSVARERQTLSHNVISSTPRMSGILAHNFSGDRH